MRRTILLTLVTTIVCGAALNVAAKPAVDLSAYRAIDELGYQEGGKAAAAVATLTASLADEDPQVRWRSARALGNLGASSASVAPRLVNLLADQDPIVQMHAGIALARIGDQSDATIDALMAKITSSDERVARAAIQAIRALDVDPARAAKHLNAVLEADDTAVMSHALEALVQAGPRAVPMLDEALKGERSAYWAALAIAEIGPEAAGCCESLAALCSTCDDADTLTQALVAAAKIGPEARSVLPAARKAAESEVDTVRIAACYALGAIGDESATELLKKLKGSGGPFQELVATWSISKLHPDDPAAQEEALRVLTAALKSDRPEVRGAAAEGLATLGAPHEKIAPVFLEAVRTAADAEKKNIADALVGLGPQVAPAMIRSLGDPETRAVAVEVLGRLGPEAIGAAEKLTEQLSATTAEQLAQLQYALAEFGPEARDAADEIAGNLRNSLEDVRHSALFALREIGAASESASQKLADFMKSAESEFEAHAAAWALSKMELEAETLALVASQLEQALEHEDERVRLETVRAIKDLGPAGAPFTAKLKKLAESDPSPTVRAAAAE